MPTEPCYRCGKPMEDYFRQLCRQCRAECEEDEAAQLSPVPKCETFHPGEYIADELEARGWSVATLAYESGLDRRIIDELIAEKRSVTRMIAHCLEAAFGSSAEMWRNLQSTFDGLARREGGE